MGKEKRKMLPAALLHNIGAGYEGGTLQLTGLCQL
jgi:hypothetical protein